MKDIGRKEIIQHIAIRQLHSFEGHPFHVKQDKEMEELVESIRQNGILHPLIIRPYQDGYEIISGHRRKFACEQLGMKEVPAIIRNLSRDEAILQMVEANLQRERIKPSEKAFAYKMKNEAMKRKAGRKRTGKDKGIKTLELIAEEYGESSKKVQRYISLTKLIPELLQKVDDGELAVTPAYELSHIPMEEQRIFWDVMEMMQSSPSLAQAQKIRKLSKEKRFNREMAEEILSEIKQQEKNLVQFEKEELAGFFPSCFTVLQKKEQILSSWKNRKIVEKRRKSYV